MPEEDDALPSEEDALTAGDDGGFDLNTWKLRLGAGKYDGHLIEMASHLAQRAITDNRRRWRIRWRGDEVTEDEYTITAASHAEDYTSMPWGVMNLSMGLDVQMNAKIAAGLLYGMARTRFNLSDKDARKAVGDLPANELLTVLDYFESEPLGKDDTDQ